MLSTILWLLIMIGALVIIRDAKKAIREWQSTPSNPSLDRVWWRLESTRYWRQYGPTVAKIMRRAGIDPKKVKVYVLLSPDEEEEAPVEVNGFIRQTLKGGDSVYIEENAFKLAEMGYDDLLEALLTHEVSHIKRQDSLYEPLLNGWRKIVVTIWGFLVPVSASLFFIEATKVLDSLGLRMGNEHIPVIGRWLVAIPLLAIIPVCVLLGAGSLTGVATVWVQHISEIWADTHAAQLCGRKGMERLLRVLKLQEERSFRDGLSNVEKTCSRATFWAKAKLICTHIYSPEKMSHPAASFRLQQLGLLPEQVNGWYAMKHYLRLLFWLVSGKGFYGESVFYLVGLAREKDSPACGTPE